MCIAQHLNAAVPESDRAASELASSEIGILGYYYGGNILDLGGLVSPGVLKYFPAEASERNPSLNYVIPRKAISELRPAYLVVFTGYGIYGLLNDPFFLMHYREQLDWPTHDYGRNFYRLYKYFP